MYELRKNRDGTRIHLQLVQSLYSAFNLIPTYTWHNLELVDCETGEIIWCGNDYSNKEVTWEELKKQYGL